ncbi:hypothetical protein Q4F19_07890 [Sphingomonas sp. BIUV-7]|uniref:Uncharacterized protein n=1 Tax=Sphingomonas natans TaxID=3063330 RepID=A0ABT8Y9G9_9SPHN|nr:hypothetical protein [Sphingomonas sp. BIUV-7]MDO6414300.1 hypothetical protein [Sphingomonas sp. BIUV-7]
MKRLNLATRQSDIAIRLRVLRGPMRTTLQNVRGAQAAETAARLIIERCLSGCAIFEPNRVVRTATFGDSPTYMKAGYFGDTEPWPTAPGEPKQPTDAASARQTTSMRLATIWHGPCGKRSCPGRSLKRPASIEAAFLLIAHRTIKWLGRAHAAQSNP